jgi:hypothetical protein
MSIIAVEDKLDPAPSASDRLNANCFCITLDRRALYEAIERESIEPDFCDTYVKSRPHLFSNVPVFLPAGALAQMQRIVEAIEAASRLPEYRRSVLGWAPAIAAQDHGPAGAFMGYDFHLGDGGPKLIEVNTNAGGAFLNAMLARAQRACCAEVEASFDLRATDDFEAAAIEMFRGEWQSQRGATELRRVAIVDERPAEQYLFPEFVLARQLFTKAGIDAVIADPSELDFIDGRLMIAGKQIDLVYNRLVDFPLAQVEHRGLRQAYEAGAVVVTPNPHNHALLADKRNLTLLSDAATLAGWGLKPEHVAALTSGIPRTQVITPSTAETFWADRKRLFFKPTSGHGGKAVYRGDKLTKGVWAEIVRGDYVAQAFAAPGERMIELDGERVPRKMDVRLYTYRGSVLLAAARLYQGQTTNFRTPGGGFAPVLTA